MSKMIPTILALVLFPLAVLANGVTGPSPELHLYWYKAEVVRVVDGDTIVVDVDLGFYTYRVDEWIRFARIDAPETHSATREAGLASKAFLEGLLPVGQSIIVQTQRDKRDSFRRYIGEIWLGDVNLNDRMVGEGHAVYREY